ncbi:MAG TPA: ATP-dependent helicase C-terminal domain-containing protein, partial [Pseudomonadales bacterium]|nr:ATP-dependent helicase C-terminal domain-containing protein [Pseudomonadales bacterium]
ALMTRPPLVNEQLAWQLLHSLEIVDLDHKLTPHGRQAYELGCHPRLAHMLLKAKRLASELQQPDLASLACLLAAILEARGLPKRGVDMQDYLRLACQGAMGSQAKQWQRKLAVSADLGPVASHAHSKDIGLLLALAYPDRIAKARGVEGFLLANGTGVTLDASDSLSLSPWLVVADFQETEGHKAGRVYLASAFDVSLLQSQLAFLVERQDVGGWDEAKGRFYAERQQRLGQIVLSSEPLKQPERAQITQALLGQIRNKGLSLLGWDDNIRQLQIRLSLLAQLDSSEAWPAVDDATLLASLESWLSPYLASVSNLQQLAKIDCYSLLRNRLSWEQQQRLDKLLPQHWPLATGTNA